MLKKSFAGMSAPKANMGKRNSSMNTIGWMAIAAIVANRIAFMGPN